MIFPRPGLGLGRGIGPVVTSGLGLVVVILVVLPELPELPSRKPLERKRRQLAQKALRESLEQLDRLVAERRVDPAIVAVRLVMLDKYRRHLLDLVAFGLPERSPKDNATRRSKVALDRKPRF